MSQRCSLALVTVFTTLAIVALAPATSRAGEVEEILAKVDRAMAAGKDMTAVMKMTIEDGGGNAKVRELQTSQLGSKLRLIRFQSPAEVKGVAFLSRGDDEMYIYMPEFGKVRRIASHTRSESFMGSDFSYDDLGSGELATKYTGKIVEREGDLVTLELVPREPDDSDVQRSVMVVDTRYYIPVRSEQYDESGTLWKTMTQDQIKKVSGYWLAHRITMRNVREGSTTVLEFSDVRYDTGLDEGDFTQRRMKRSR